MKKNMKKIVSVLLAMVMIIAMSLPVFAEEVTPEETPIAGQTLTIKDSVVGHKYMVYQMLSGDVSGLNNGKGTLANVAAGDALAVKEANAETGTAAYTVDDFIAGIKNLSGSDITDYALQHMVENAAADAELTGTGRDVWTNLEPGYYVVKDVYKDNGADCAAYMVAVVGDTTMSPKSSIPDIDKNITDDDANKAIETTGTSKKTDTAAIGDTINYELTSTVPVTEGYKYYYYVVNDTMSKGLTFGNDVAVKIVCACNPTEENPTTDIVLTKDTDYYVYVDPAADDGSVSFRIAFKDMKEYASHAGDAISITYSAVVNEEAEIGLDPNTNTVNLQYSNNPDDTFKKDKADKPSEPGVPEEPSGPDDKSKPQTGVTPDRITKTYVTQLTIQKIDGEKGNFIPALADAEFTLTGDGLNDVILTSATSFVAAGEGETAEYYKLNDGTYTKVAPVTEGDDKTSDSYAELTPNYVKKTTITSCTDAESGTSTSITATVDDQGQIIFTGLNVGTYKLVETKVPTGYNKCKDIEFKIEAAQVGESTALEGTAITWSDLKGVLNQENGVFDKTIENNKGTVLPSTGGIGTTLFYVIGLILVMGAGVVLVARRRAR